MLLFAGLLVGCWTAWYWVSREQRAIGAPDREEDDRREHRTDGCVWLAAARRRASGCCTSAACG
jgi:hypothetical protein